MGCQALYDEKFFFINGNHHAFDQLNRPFSDTVIIDDTVTVTFLGEEEFIKCSYLLEVL
jgi:hypothetical protein